MHAAVAEADPFSLERVDDTIERAHRSGRVIAPGALVFPESQPIHAGAGGRLLQ